MKLLPSPSLASDARRSGLPSRHPNQDSPDPEPSRGGLFGGHHVPKWLPAKHRRPQGWKLMGRRNACKTLAWALRNVSWRMVTRVPVVGNNDPVFGQGESRCANDSPSAA
jgi:hypothetical protein